MPGLEVSGRASTFRFGTMHAYRSLVKVIEARREVAGALCRVHESARGDGVVGQALEAAVKEDMSTVCFLGMEWDYSELMGLLSEAKDVVEAEDAEAGIVRPEKEATPFLSCMGGMTMLYLVKPEGTAVIDAKVHNEEWQSPKGLDSAAFLKYCTEGHPELSQHLDRIRVGTVSLRFRLSLRVQGWWWWW